MAEIIPFLSRCGGLRQRRARQRSPEEKTAAERGSQKAARQERSAAVAAGGSEAAPKNRFIRGKKRLYNSIAAKRTCTKGETAGMNAAALAARRGCLRAKNAPPRRKSTVSQGDTAKKRERRTAAKSRMARERTRGAERGRLSLILSTKDSFSFFGIVFAKK